MPQGNINIKAVEKKFRNSEFLPEIVQLLMEGHTVTLCLRGYSMRPFLEDGRDKVLLVKAENVKVGMPVLAEMSKGHFVLHRVVDIDGDKVTLRGDGNIAVERCLMQDIKGEAVGFYRKGRKTLDKTSGWKWRIYSAVWTTLLPVRRYLLAIYRRVVLNIW